MRFLFSTKSSASLNHIWLLIYRVTISGFMLTHGIPKFNRLVSGNVGEFADPLGVGHMMSLILTIFGEVVAPIDRKSVV